MEKNLVEEAVTEYFGERCPEYEPGCACCEGWKQYDKLVMDGDWREWYWPKEENQDGR